MTVSFKTDRALTKLVIEKAKHFFRQNSNLHHKVIYINNDADKTFNILKILADFGFICHVWEEEERNNRLDRILIQSDPKSEDRTHLTLLDHDAINLALMTSNKTEPDLPDFIDEMLSNPHYATHKDQYGRLWKPSILQQNYREGNYGYFFVNNKWTFVELEDFIELTLLR